MSLLTAIERMAEEVVEGYAQRLFRPPLQPVQVAKSAARALSESRLDGPHGQVVANQYVVSLHPTDFERFKPIRKKLAHHVLEYLTEYAGARGLTTHGPWGVAIRSDRRVRPGRAMVEANFVYADGSAEPPRSRLAANQRGQPDEPLPASVEAQPRIGLLESDSGRSIHVAAPETRIGRARDNDVVIDDPRVSRHHATIRCDRSRFVLIDAASTNGTTIDGAPVAEAVLANGSEIGLGGVKFVFRLSAPGGEHETV